MKNYLKTLMIIAVMSIIACNDDDLSDEIKFKEFNGIVLSYPSYEPVSDVLVIFGWIDSIKTDLQGVIWDSDTVLTDNGGNYYYKSYKLLPDNNNLYELNIKKDHYAMISPEQKLNFIHDNSAITDRIIIGKNAFLKLNFKNTLESQNSIAVEISGNSLSVEGEDYQIFHDPINLTFNPQFKDTTYLFELAYDLYRLAHIRSGTIENDLVEYWGNNIDIELISQDTTTYTIEL